MTQELFEEVRKAEAERSFLAYEKNINIEDHIQKKVFYNKLRGGQ